MKTKNIEKLIKELHLDYVNSDINSKNFPDQPRKVLGPVELMKIDRIMTTQEIEEKIKNDGYVPANSYELLEWAKGWNGEDWVIALGSKWNDARGDPRALGLWSRGDERELDLSYCLPQGRWGQGCVFARRKLLSTKSLDTLPSLDSLSLETRIKTLEDKMVKLEKIINL